MKSVTTIPGQARHTSDSGAAAGVGVIDTPGVYPAEGGGPSDHLSMRLFGAAFLYLLLPTALVLIAFQSWKIALPTAVATAAACWWLVQALRAAPRAQPASLRDTWPYLLMAAGFVWLSGALPPFAETYDWQKHYALFNELVEQAWPAAVPNGGALATLRYSLGYYVVPALVAKHAGYAFLGAAIFAWTTLGLYLALVLAFHARSRPVASRFLLCAVFLLFSGADIVGRYLTGFVHPVPMHFEWWAKFGELPSSTTSLLWTPQHALSAWLGTFLVLRFPARALQCAGVLGAAIAVWSPFSAVGLAPVFLWAVHKVGFRPILGWMNLLAAPVLLAVAGYFLTRGSAGIPAGFIWTALDFRFGTWCAFIVLEFGAIALALYLVERRNAALIVTGAGFLALLSLFSMGAYNDLLMRGSIPALAILAALAATSVAYAPNTARKAPLVVCLVLGLVTPLGEIMRGISGERMPKSASLRIDDVLSGPGQILAPQYLAPGFSGTLRRTPVLALRDLSFSGFGEGRIDTGRKRIEADSFTDAALITAPLSLPRGSYEIEVELDLDVKAGPRSTHAAHLSLHGQHLLATIGDATAKGYVVKGYFRVKDAPVQFALGLGGWAEGKGVLELKKLTISRIATTGR